MTFLVSGYILIGQTIIIVWFKTPTVAVSDDVLSCFIHLPNSFLPSFNIWQVFILGSGRVFTAIRWCRDYTFSGREKHVLQLQCLMPVHLLMSQFEPFMLWCCIQKTPQIMTSDPVLYIHHCIVFSIHNNIIRHALPTYAILTLSPIAVDRCVTQNSSLWHVLYSWYSSKNKYYIPLWFNYLCIMGLNQKLLSGFVCVNWK